MSPTGGELYLVVGFGYKVITDVYRAVFRSRLDVGLDLFGVEVSHLLDFTHGTHQEFTAYYVFIQTVVTVDADFIDGSLATFVDTHFQVDGVAHDVYFHRFEAVEQITVVVVKVTDGIVIGHCTLFK